MVSVEFAEAVPEQVEKELFEIVAVNEVAGNVAVLYQTEAALFAVVNAVGVASAFTANVLAN